MVSSAWLHEPSGPRNVTKLSHDVAVSLPYLGRYGCLCRPGQLIEIQQERHAATVSMGRYAWACWTVGLLLR